MILRHYPDNPNGININTLVHFTSQSQINKKYVNPLSIRCTMKGAERHESPNGNYSVTPDQFLILNEGSASEFYVENDTESLSVFFDQGFAKKALESLITPGDKMLNFSFKQVSQPVTFFEKLYPHNKYISPLLMKLRIASRMNHNDRMFIDESCFMLLENMLLLHRELYKEITKLPPVKLSTKTELYRRICIAKEYMDSCYRKNISLEDIAAEACLSQYHFLRVFKTIYKVTPHQYLLRKRIDLAFNLLRNSEMPVTQICYEIGFESPGSFSWLFRRKFGMSPEMFRQQYNKFLYWFRTRSTS